MTLILLIVLGTWLASVIRAWREQRSKNRSRGWTGTWDGGPPDYGHGATNRGGLSDWQSPALSATKGHKKHCKKR